MTQDKIKELQAVKNNLNSIRIMSDNEDVKDTTSGQMINVCAEAALAQLEQLPAEAKQPVFPAQKYGLCLACGDYFSKDELADEERTALISLGILKKIDKE